VKYVAFLRAVNVGGRVVKMDRLRALFEQLPLADVETFIASGNVIFTSSSRSPQALEARIERHLLAELGYAVPTFLRTPAELAEVVRKRPFRDVALSAKGTALYVGFVGAAPGPGVRKTFLGMKSAADEFEIRGREVYWLCRGRMMESLYSGAQLERALGMPATFRNLNTVEKLAARHA
jgi:uncharacterized protein (DUF1697 family)